VLEAIIEELLEDGELTLPGNELDYEDEE